MKIFYTNAAAEQLSSLPRDLQLRIAKKMRFYADQDDPLSFAKTLTGYKSTYRFRVGMYRIIFEVENDTLSILVVEKRDKVYD